MLKNWNLNEPTEKYRWLSWTRKENTRAHSVNSETYKLYISPHFSFFPQVFRKAQPVLTNSKAFAFKTGIDRYGILRPDKFVTYFMCYKDMLDAAEQLKIELKEYKAQGVPFTAQLDEEGMISWGIDPPGKDVIKELEGGSWRASVTEKLAVAIVQAQAGKLSKAEALQYIFNKISLDNIDPVTWSPLKHSSCP